MTLHDLLELAGVSSVTTAIVFVLADFWKPFFASYMGKKGERLANAEDIDRILKEVRLVTAETETIKAQIAAGIWDRQTLLIKRIEVYGALHASMMKLSQSLSQVNAAMIRLSMIRSENATEDSAAEAQSRHQRAADRLASEQEDVITKTCLSRLFAGPALDALLSGVFDSMNINEENLRNPQSFFAVWGPTVGRVLAEMRLEIELGQAHSGTALAQPRRSALPLVATSPCGDVVESKDFPPAAARLRMGPAFKPG